MKGVASLWLINKTKQTRLIFENLSIYLSDGQYLNHCFAESSSPVIFRQVSKIRSLDLLEKLSSSKKMFKLVANA
jgi:hypothetical protein